MRKLVCLVFAAAIALLSCPNTFGETQEEQLKAEIATLQKRVSDAKVAELVTRSSSFDHQVAELARCQAAEEIKVTPPPQCSSPPYSPPPPPTAQCSPLPPPCPAKEAVAVTPVPEVRVNFICVDHLGRVPDCYKRIRITDIPNWKEIFSSRPYVADGIHFNFQGKPVDWNQKVVFSYPYADSEPPVTGAIRYTPDIAGLAARVINIVSSDVYQDKDGTIRYEDNGKFSCAPKGADYTTAKCILPLQR